MMLWVLAAGLALLVLATIAYPLLRGPGRMGRSADYDLAVYRDQLAEVDRNVAQGLIGEAEAEAARAEIGRRILDADRRRRANGGKRGAAGQWPVWVGAVLLAASIFGAGGMYLHLGNPDKPTVPFAQRDVPKTRDAIIAASRDPSREKTAAATGSSGAGDGMPDLDTVEQRLTERLEEQPEDVRGWLLLGRTRLQQGDYGGARDAFAEAHDLRPENPRIMAGYGEAIVMANDGTVTPKAGRLISKAHAEQPEDPQTNYYLALADFQQGKAREALQRWKRMVRGAAPDAPWLDVVERHMAAAERELNIEPGSTFASVAPDGAAETSNDGSAAGPSREQMQAAREMAPEERQKMIRGMVDKLAARLEKQPDDVEGWLRLARSYNVLGKPEKARDALKRASEVAPRNVEVLARYARAIRRAAGQQQTPESLEVSRRILNIDSDHPEALWFLGVHAARSGNTGKARDLFNRALAVLPDSPQTAELRKRARDMVGDG